MAVRAGPAGSGIGAGGTALSVEGLSRRFDGAHALDGITLDVAPGECLAVLGASGCGKSTLLRLVAGLDRPDGGRIALDGRTVADDDVFEPPERRSVGVVFQSYALWPHLDVAAHARFPLEAAGVRGTDSERRVAEALALVGLESFAARRPAELSGGQRQRVALARCLAQRARLILMDEPLANLDPHLRGTMEREIDRVRRESGATVLYVTHDQREAMALADRIAVLDAGRLLQLATPERLYAEPADRRVAAFIGEGVLLAARVLGPAGEHERGGADELQSDRERAAHGDHRDERGGEREAGYGRDSSGDGPVDGHVDVELGGGVLRARTGKPAGDRPRSGDTVELLVRPEHVRVRRGEAGRGEIAARVVGGVFRGDHVALELAVERVGTLEARVGGTIEPGTPVALAIDDAWIVPGVD